MDDEGHESIRLRFWLRTGSAGLVEDKIRCRMCGDGRCALCTSHEIDVGHFGVVCEEKRKKERSVVV